MSYQYKVGQFDKYDDGELETMAEAIADEQRRRWLDEVGQKLRETQEIQARRVAP